MQLLCLAAINMVVVTVCNETVMSITNAVVVSVDKSQLKLKNDE